MTPTKTKKQNKKNKISEIDKIVINAYKRNHSQEIDKLLGFNPSHKIESRGKGQKDSLLNGITVSSDISALFPIIKDTAEYNYKLGYQKALDDVEKIIQDCFYEYPYERFSVDRWNKFKNKLKELREK